MPRLYSSLHCADANHRAPLPELRPRAPPLRCQANQASVASFVRRRLEPQPQPLFPGHQTPLAVKLHRLLFRSVDATPTIARVPTTIPNREPPTTTTRRRPSPQFPSSRVAPPWKLPLRWALLSDVPPPVSPPHCVALAPLRRPTLPPIAAGIGRPPPP
jgi:hypothetical protein